MRVKCGGSGEGMMEEWGGVGGGGEGGGGGGWVGGCRYFCYHCRGRAKESTSSKRMSYYYY